MDDNLDIDQMKDVYGDLNDFDKRLKASKQVDPYAQNSDSSDEDNGGARGNLNN